MFFEKFHHHCWKETFTSDKRQMENDGARLNSEARPTAGPFLSLIGTVPFEKTIQPIEPESVQHFSQTRDSGHKAESRDEDIILVQDKSKELFLYEHISGVFTGRPL